MLFVKLFSLLFRTHRQAIMLSRAADDTQPLASAQTAVLATTATEIGCPLVEERECNANIKQQDLSVDNASELPNGKIVVPSLDAWDATSIATNQFEQDPFKLVVPALDQLFELLPGDGESEKFACIRQRSEKFKLDYLRLYSDPDMTMDYSDIVSQVAYLYKYVPVRATLIKIILSKSDEVWRFLAQGDVKVTCIGGGPGTDVIGLLGFLAARGFTGNIQTTIYDRELGWESCWKAMQDTCLGLEGIKTHYLHLDLTDESTWYAWRNATVPELYIISYCLTEVRHHSQIAAHLFSDMLASIVPGSIIVVVDNSNSELRDVSRYQWFENLLQEQKFKRLIGEDHIQRRLTSAYSTTSDRWYGRSMVGHNPQKEFNAYYGVYLKQG